jgi:hypothetical protein
MKTKRFNNETEAYANETDKWFSSIEVSWDLEREDIESTHCVRSATDCEARRQMYSLYFDYRVRILEVLLTVVYRTLSVINFYRKIEPAKSLQ